MLFKVIQSVAKAPSLAKVSALCSLNKALHNELFLVTRECVMVHGEARHMHIHVCVDFADLQHVYVVCIHSSIIADHQSSYMYVMYMYVHTADEDWHWPQHIG